MRETLAWRKAPFGDGSEMAPLRASRGLATCDIDDAHCRDSPWHRPCDAAPHAMERVRRDRRHLARRVRHARPCTGAQVHAVAGGNAGPTLGASALEGELVRCTA
jgi:hypothetical protein